MNNIYFECKHCGKHRQIYYDMGVYNAHCGCKKHSKYQHFFGQCFFLANESLEELLKGLDVLGIKWAYDEIVWKYEINKEYFYANAYDGKDFVHYRYGEVYFKGSLLNPAGWGANVNLNPLCDCLDTEAEVQQACEQDFQRRKANNE